MNLPNLKQHLFDYKTASNSKNEFKSVLYVYFYMKPQKRKPKIISGLQEDQSAEMLFQNDLIIEPMTCFKFIRIMSFLTKLTFAFRLGQTKFNKTWRSFR